MTQIFKDGDELIPVTLVEAGPCKVLQIKNKETDGYSAVQIGLQEIVKKNQIKKTAKGKNFKVIREFPSLNKEDPKVGDMIEVSIFQEGDIVELSGISKGKGFQGGMKRWGFAGAGASHGVKHNQRKIGSIGSSFPQRVFKGKKMPGRMGSDRVTVKNLKVIRVDNEKNLIALKGAVPGRRGTILEIRKKEKHGNPSL